MENVHVVLTWTFIHWSRTN